MKTNSSSSLSSDPSDSHGVRRLPVEGAISAEEFAFSGAFSLNGKKASQELLTGQMQGFEKDIITSR